MRRVRFMTWCPRSVSGVHLPAFAASEAGLFADRDLDVAWVPASQAPEAVACGEADFALTSIVHMLAAQTRAGGRLPVRFVTSFHQRNPIVAVVRDDSGRRTPGDLAGARAARWSIPWFAREYAGAMNRMGLAPPVLIDTPGGLDEALGSGAVDVLPMWMDDVAPAQALGMQLHHRGETFGIHTVALDLPVYSTGLVAGDHVPLEVVQAMRESLAAAHVLQREQPEPGLAGFSRCFPEISEQHARLSWTLYEPYAFDGAATGGMDAMRWQDTIAYSAETHGLTAFPWERICRPDVTTVAPASTPSF